MKGRSLSEVYEKGLGDVKRNGKAPPPAAQGSDLSAVCRNFTANRKMTSMQKILCTELMFSLPYVLIHEVLHCAH